MIEKVKSTLLEAANGLNFLNGDLCIIGSAALILSGFPMEKIGDIDILTTSENSDTLKKLWADKLVTTEVKKESDLFRSNFASYQFSEMEIEVSGDLEIFKDNKWEKVMVNKFEVIQLNDLNIKIPTLDEQIRILNLFGREKDKRRLRFIYNHIKQ